MRIVWRDWNLVDEFCAKSLDRASRRLIVGVASNDHGIVNGANKRSDGAARLERIAVAAKWLKNLETDVTGTKPDVPGISHAEIDVADIGAVCNQNAEMISRDEIA